MDLLDQIEHSFNVVMSDGAYDSVKPTNAILNTQPDASIVISLPSDAVISKNGNTIPVTSKSVYSKNLGV